MNPRILLPVLFLLVPLLVSARLSDSPVNYTDSGIGTPNNGSNCVIGPQLPFGSIYPSPQTPNGEHKGYEPGQPNRGFGYIR
jgi:putative alpha-1,2-mannosidase